jgi:steroid 5-alpha reductase family enzyme
VVYENISLSTAVSHLTYTEKLLLTGVTAWGVRLFYRVASRSIARGKDDPRYEEAKKEEGFWNKVFFTTFMPEALFQAAISLPFVLPFRPTIVFGPLLDVHPELTHALGVALFSAGFVMEVLADTQLAAHQKNDPDDLNREGVWSIVRHPNYLGDALIHASFPLLLWSAGFMHPLALLAPVANYVFLRYVGGDAENETSQEHRYVKESHKKHGQFEEYKRDKNSFWPKPKEATNPWTWAVLGAGVAGVALERGFRSYLHG